MKPLAIADYLGHLGSTPTEKVSSRLGMSPFRPRSLQAVQSLDPPASGCAADEAVAIRDQMPHAQWEPAPALAEASIRESLAAREAAKVEEMALRLAEAYARGREEGLAKGRAETQDLFAAERFAVQQQVVMERLEFQLNEYAQFDGAIRTGFAEVEENIGAAVARILAPFLAKEAIEYVAAELCKTIERLCADGSPGLITIRGPERLLKRLRDRLADMAVDVDYVDDKGVEAVVDVNATRIVTGLRPWADLLASLDS